MTILPDSTLVTGFMGTLFRRYIRAAVQILIILLVIAGIARSLQLAWNDIHSTQRKTTNRIAEIDKLLVEATDSLERERLLQEKEAVGKTRMDWNNFRFFWMPISIVAGFFSILMPGVLWWLVLRSFHRFPPFMVTQAAYSVGSLGKYVPGKAMVLVLRSAAMRRWHIPVAASVTATIVEVLISLSTAGALGAVTLSASHPPRWLFHVSIGAALLSLIPIVPPVFNRLLVEVAKRKKLHESTARTQIGWGDMFRCWGLAAIGWVFMGFSLFAAVACVSPIVSLGTVASEGMSSILHLLVLSIATATLAFVIGFLSMLPGGAGVRELVVTLILAPIVGYAPALVAAVIYRISNLAAELSMAGLTSLASRHTKPHLD